MKNIAVFASGTGSNARRLIEHFEPSDVARVVLVVSNKPDAGVLDIARKHGVATQIISRASFYESEELLAVLREKRIDFIVLAGFLWLVPTWLVRVSAQDREHPPRIAAQIRRQGHARECGCMRRYWLPASPSRALPFTS